MRKIVLFTEGNGNDGDRRYSIPAPNGSQLFMLPDGPRMIPGASGFSNFSLLPAATTLAAGKDPLLVTIGTGTEVVTRKTGGGINIKTQASSPADNDNAILIGVAGSPSFVTWNLTAGSIIAPRFRTRVRLNQIEELVFGAGLDQNITNPVSSATAGDGASFQFDPGSEVSMHANQATNWILAQKKNGTDTYLDSGIPVLAGVDYELEIRWSDALVPSYYIDGVLVGTGVAQTDDIAVGINIGIQIDASVPSGQRDFDISYVQLDPTWSV